ncbi:MAG TPA: hypothetical protein VJV23_17070 [Candidatus Polarisedimenticolia bacterium]|nr:hypothetical protein [Candidatus Polarisedimenticolia bacterium]
MRKHRVTLIGLLLLGPILLLGTPALAGDYHKGSTLICSDCHVMHFSQSHGYNANGTGFYTGLGGTGPYEYLLRNEINDLCLTCHDGQTFAPDVLEAPTDTYVRQAGALNRTGVAPYYTSTGHTLNATDTAPGGTWAPDPVHGLTCVDCHGPHGRGGPTVANPYRNLSPTAGGGSTFDPPSYATGTNNPAMDVFQRSASAYGVDDVDFNEPDQTRSAMGNWCGACHSNFHGTVGSAQLGGTGSPAEHFDRHPTAGVDVGAVSGGHSSRNVFATGSRSGAGPGPKINWVKVMTATGNWKPNLTADVTDHTPSCFSCHKAHGNQNAFGLIYMNPLSGTVTEEGTPGGTYRNMCAQCHTQAL